MGVSQAIPVPINVVGSSTFGRYPKISLEKTYNMFISDGWLINYAGFKKRAEVLATGEGRGFFRSIRGGFAIAVLSSSVYRLSPSLAPEFIGNIDTVSGDVSIDENLSQQICIADGQAAYIFHYDNGGAFSLTKQTLTFLGNPIIPNYVSYHNTFFLISSTPFSDNPQNWYAFERATDTTIQLNSQFAIQTKPDNALAVVRIPGRGNNVIVFGSAVAEIWTQVGGTENYRRVQSFNIDNGVVAVSTIATNEQFVCWLAQSENNAPSIMWTDGSSVNRISSDGIDYVMQTIQHPDESAAFFFRQDGHLFFQLSFFNPVDNLTLFYDFNTQKFFHASNQDMDYHPARKTIFFNERTYFISIDDASIYEMATDFISYDYSIEPDSEGDVIPRIRICKSVRRDDSSRFRACMFTFWLEQGVNDFFLLNPDDPFVCQGLIINQVGDGFILAQNGDNLISQSGFCATNLNRPRVDMSFSKNGNQSFSNIVGKYLNAQGRYINQIRWWRMGQCNEFTIQLRFWGMQRFVAYDGILEIRQ